MFHYLFLARLKWWVGGRISFRRSATRPKLRFSPPRTKRGVVGKLPGSEMSTETSGLVEGPFSLENLCHSTHAVRLHSFLNGDMLEGCSRCVVRAECSFGPAPFDLRQLSKERKDRKIDL